MKDTPNMFRVEFKTMDEHDLSKGVIKKVVTVRSLPEVQQIRNVISVIPMFVDFEHPMTTEDINQAILQKEIDDERRTKEKEIAKGKNIKRSKAAIRATKSARVRCAKSRKTSKKNTLVK